MINFFYNLVFLVPSIFVAIIGCIANLLAHMSSLLGEVCNQYFEHIYGETED